MSIDDASEDAIQIRTFLIADIRGYTLFTQERGDEAAAKLAAKFAEVARAGVESRGGTVIELRGDEALAVFGSARQAIRAAVELQDRFVEETRSDPELPLPVGIGVDAGEAVALEGGYRGGALNLAARLCGQAGPGEILASREVSHLARKVQGVTYKDLGELHLKGLAEPVSVIRVTSDGADPATFFAVAVPRPAAQSNIRIWRSRVPVVAGIVVLGIALVAAITVPIFLRGGSTLESLGANSVGILDLDSRKIVGDVPVGQAPTAIAWGGGYGWVANAGDNTISKIDPSTRTVVDTIPVDAGPTSIAFGDNAVWVAAATDRKLDQISPTTDSVVRRIAIGGGAASVAAGPGAVWVAMSSDNVVLRIDAKSGRSRPISVGVSPSALALGDSLWVANTGSDNVTRIAPDTGATTGTVPVGGGPAAIVATEDAVWVANADDGTVMRIDPQTAVVESTYPAGEGPGALVVAGGSVWAANRFGNDITRIDQASRTTSEIRLGAQPIAAALVGDALWTVVQASAGAHDGGTLVVAADFIDHIDPNLGYVSTDWSLSSLTNDGLVGFERAGGIQSATLVPDLATSIPAPTDGGRTYTFQLRTGIRYSSGAVVEPEDFRAAIERSFQGDGLGEAFYMSLVGARACDRDPRSCDLSEAIVADDASNTVTFHLSQPDPSFLYVLARPGAFAVPDGTPVVDPEKQPVPATGPYMITSYEPGKRIELVRNPQFQEWSAQAQPRGFPDEIDWILGLSSEEEVSMVEHGKADITFDSPQADMLRSLSINLGGQIHSDPEPYTVYMWLNTTIEPFDKLLARQAVNFAVDRERLVQLNGGPLLARVTCQVLPSDMPGYVPYCPYTLHPDASGRYDGPSLAEARHLIQRSGTRGAKVALLVHDTDPNNVPTGRYLVSVLNALGYDATLKIYPGNLSGLDRFNRDGLSGRYQSGMTNWLTDYPSAFDFVDVLFSCASPFRHADARFCEPGVQRLIDGAARAEIFDPASAPNLWAQAEHAIVDAAPWVPLYNGRSNYGVHLISARVGDYQASQSYVILLDQLWVR